MSKLDPTEEQTREFYIYEDAGRPVVVDSLDAVPHKYESTVRTVTLPVPTERDSVLDSDAFRELFEAPARVAETVVAATEGKPTAPAMDPSSAMFGAAVGFAAGVLLGHIFRAPGWALKAGLILTLGTMAGGAYLGWVRTQAGLGNAPLAHPGTLIDDARKAAAEMEEHNRRQLELLQQSSEP